MCIIKRKKIRTMILHDIFVPNDNRSQSQLLQDAVMQLKNEIANSGALKIEGCDDGKFMVTLEVVI